MSVTIIRWGKPGPKQWALIIKAGSIHKVLWYSRFIYADEARQSLNLPIEQVRIIK